MQTLFSTDAYHPKDQFRRWQEIVSDQLLFCELLNLEEQSFEARLQHTEIGGIGITRMTHSALQTSVTPALLRRQENHDTLYVVFKRSGRSIMVQGGREAITGPGDIYVVDQEPLVERYTMTSSTQVLQVRRDRIERVLGSARQFTSLTFGSHLAATQLVTTYFENLVRLRDALAPDSAARMVSIGIDLIVASIADRMAQDVPKPVHGTVVVQRAKAYIEANLHDSSLDPPQLATAMGVSLRRLQELFHERGQHISDWIWERRLTAAAGRLSDPSCLHMPIGTLAYGCGFVSQAHFARRFRHRFGLPPSEYRAAANLKGSSMI